MSLGPEGTWTRARWTLVFFALPPFDLFDPFPSNLSVTLVGTKLNGGSPTFSPLLFMFLRVQMLDFLCTCLELLNRKVQKVFTSCALLLVLTSEPDVELFKTLPANWIKTKLLHNKLDPFTRVVTLSGSKAQKKGNVSVEVPLGCFISYKQTNLCSCCEHFLLCSNF